MAVAVTCEGCGARYRIGDSPVEKRFKCKKCGFVVIAPASLTAGDVEIRVVDDESPAVTGPPAERVMARRPDRDPPPLEQFLPPESAVVPLAPPPIPTGIATVVRTSRQRSTMHRPAAHRPAERSFRRSTAAPEGFSPLLITVFVLLTMANAVIASVRRPDIASAIWTYAITLLVMYFLVLSPMTLLGVWVASKVGRFELAAPAYLKAGAMAALPAVLFGIVSYFPPNPVLLTVLILSIVPIAFIVCKLVFSLLFGEAALAFVFGGILWGIGLFITVGLSLAVTAGGIAAKKQQAIAPSPESVIGNWAGSNTSSADSTSSDRPSSSPPADYRPSVRPPPTDYVLSQLDSLKTRAAAVNTSNWLADASRESAADTIIQLQSALDPLAKQATTDDRKARVQDVVAEIDRLKVTAPTLPSESPDPDIYKAPVNLRTWVSEPSSAMVAASYRRYQLGVPKEALVDLGTTEESDTGLGWTLGSAGRLLVTELPRKVPNQFRPWVKTKSFMKSNDRDLFTVDATNVPVEVSYGTINGVAATRIARRPVGDSAPSRYRSTETQWVKYVIPDGRSWVVVTCTAAVDDPRTMESLEQSAVTVRQIRAGEAHVDPFTPAGVVARLPDERAEALIRKFGAAAEPALLGRLDESKFGVKEQVIKLLGEVGTKKSVAPLMAIIRADDWTFAPLAKTALKAISPEDMDDAAAAILELQGKSFRHDEALRTLASCKPKPDDSRRTGVSTMLVNMAKDHMAMNGSDPGLVGDALAVWGTANAVPALLPMLDYANKWDFGRGNAMIVLGHTKDKRAAFPLCRWLIEDTRTAETALIAMGPVAEDDVIKVLTNKDAGARNAAVAILAEIGTKKSLSPLKSFGSGKRDPMAKDIADGAIAAITDRMDREAAATRPSTPGQDTTKWEKGGSPLFPDEPDPAKPGHRRPGR